MSVTSAKANERSSEPRVQPDAFAVQAEVLKLALRRGVKVSFGEGRRASDMAMVLLRGDREKVLALPTLFEEELALHVHVVRSAFISSGSSFELLLVLTLPPEVQPLRDPERRAALKRQFEELLKASPQDLGLLIRE